MSWKDCDCGMARIRAEIERCSTCEIAAHKDEQIAALTRELDEARRLHMGQAGRAAGWRARARYAREALERLIELVADDPEAKDTTTPLCVAVTVARAEVTAIEEAERRDADRSTPPLELTVREAARQRVPLDGADAQALEGALAGEGEAKRCAWTYDETHFAWDSSCGEKWILMDGGPSENEIRFCHGCGKPVEIACETEVKGGEE